MRRSTLMLIGLISILSVLPLIVAAQEKKKSGFQEVYTGTIVSMNGGLASTTFSLNIKDYTSDVDAQRYLALLAEGNQTNLLDAIRDLKMGRLTPERDVGRDLLVVRKTQLADNRMRIVVAFERWQRFVEIRNGYRTLDYPFGIMEIVVDSKGKGGGTFIAACKIDLKRDKKTGKYQLELENFGSFPHKVMGVMLRK